MLRYVAIERQGKGLFKTFIYKVNKGTCSYGIQNELLEVCALLQGKRRNREKYGGIFASSFFLFFFFPSVFFLWIGFGQIRPVDTSAYELASVYIQVDYYHI